MIGVIDVRRENETCLIFRSISFFNLDCIVWAVCNSNVFDTIKRESCFLFAKIAAVMSTMQEVLFEELSACRPEEFISDLF